MICVMIAAVVWQTWMTDGAKLMPSAVAPEGAAERIDLVAAKGMTVTASFAVKAPGEGKLSVTAKGFQPEILSVRRTLEDPNAWFTPEPGMGDKALVPTALGREFPAAKAGEAHEFWLAFAVPADAKPGVAACSLSVAQGGKEIASVPVNLRVLDFVLEPASARYGDPSSLDGTKVVRGGTPALTDTKVRPFTFETKELPLGTAELYTNGTETVEAVLLDGELATDLWAERWRNVGVKTYLKLQDPKVKNPDLWRRLALKGFFMGCDGVVLPSVAGDSLAAAAMRDSLTDIALLSQVLRLSHRLMLCEKDFKVKLEGRMGCFWVDHLGGDQTDDVPLLRLEALARLVRLQAFVDTWCK